MLPYEVDLNSQSHDENNESWDVPEICDSSDMQQRFQIQVLEHMMIRDADYIT